MNELDLFNQPKDIKILHLAPERNISRILHNHGFKNYVCGDLFTEGYSYPDYVQNMNVLNIPFGDNHFDLIICNHLLEHVPNDLDAMKELFRVLKPNGKAILQVPISKNSEKTFEDFSITDPKEREIVFGQFDHVRIYGQDYPERLESIGFSVKRVNITGEYPKFGLASDEDIFIGYK
ncbi:MAG: class I SAM-dependent methyltransferase [Putridiphycobacter sp.]